MSVELKTQLIADLGIFILALGAVLMLALVLSVIGSWFFGRR